MNLFYGHRGPKSVVSVEVHQKPRQSQQHPRYYRSIGVALLSALLFLTGCQNQEAPLPPDNAAAQAQEAEEAEQAEQALEQLTACQSNLKQIAMAMEMHSTDAAGKYPNSLDELIPTYLKTLPKCPAGGSYRAYFGPDAPGNNTGAEPYKNYYYVECFGENHTAADVTGDFPAYSGLVGLMTEPQD